MATQNGPGKFLWQQSLCKTRLPQPDFTMVALDRGHRYLATFNLRMVYVLELDSSVERERRTAVVPKEFCPNVRAITYCTWCCGESLQHLLAVVVGADVLIYSRLTMGLVGHVVAPCGRAVHITPLIAWGGLPNVLVTSGNSGLQRGIVKIWRCETDNGTPTAVPVANMPSFDGSASIVSAVSQSSEPAIQLTHSFVETISPCLLNGTPHQLSLHPTKSYVAVYGGTAVVVIDTRSGEKVWGRDFLTPVRSIAWSATKLSSLLVLAHKDGEWRLNAPLLAEVDVSETPAKFEEEAQTHSSPHPLSGIASVRLHALPIPFAPKLLLTAFSSQRCEKIFVRSDSVTQDATAVEGSLYSEQVAIEPSKGIRSIQVRRVDGEKERSLHLIILYSNGMLVARSFMSRPMDLLLEKQIRLLQERREVEVVKIQSAGATLDSIKLKVKVAASQVQFLEHTFHSSANPPVVFFEVLAKQGELMPEVTASNNCIKNETEHSLEEKVLDEIVGYMRQAILDAVRENKPWLLAMLDACHEKIASFGTFQPSQLKKFLPRVPTSLELASLEDEGGGSGTLVPSTSNLSGGGGDGGVAGSGGGGGAGGLGEGLSTPRAALEQCPFLPIQSPQVCYKRAYIIHPRYCAGVFSPDGRLILYGFGHDAGLLSSRSQLLMLSLNNTASTPPSPSPSPSPSPTEPIPRGLCSAGQRDQFRPEWRFSGAPSLMEDILWNTSVAVSNGAHDEASVLRVLTQLVVFTGVDSVAAKRSATVLFRKALSAQRFNFVGAMACTALLGYVKRSANEIQKAVEDEYCDGEHTMKSRVLQRKGALCCLPVECYTEAYACMGFLHDNACVAGVRIQALEVARCMALLLQLVAVVPDPCTAAECIPAEQEEQLAADALLLCAVCSRAVRGLSSTCRLCGHVSHVLCLKGWQTSSNSPLCPLGCGCHCSFEW